MTPTQTEADFISDLLHGVISEFVMHKQELSVSVEHPGGDFLSVRIDCHPGDAGKVIGAKGAHFMALATLCAMYGRKQGMFVELKPLDQPRVKDRYAGFRQRTDWPREKLLGLIEQMAKAAFTDDEAIDLECVHSATDSDVLVHVSMAESEAVFSKMNGVLRVLGNAIGKPNGRTITVRVVQDRAPCLAPQPENAHGRFAKAVGL